MKQIIFYTLGYALLFYIALTVGHVFSIPFYLDYLGASYDEIEQGEPQIVSGYIYYSVIVVTLIIAGVASGRPLLRAFDRVSFLRSIPAFLLTLVPIILVWSINARDPNAGDPQLAVYFWMIWPGFLAFPIIFFLSVRTGMFLHRRMPVNCLEGTHA